MQEPPESREFGGFDLTEMLKHWLDEDHSWHAYSRETYLYFIGDGQFVKIGISDDPAERLRQIQVDNPRLVKLLAVYYCPVGIEVAIHGHFVTDRVRGEWFRRTPRIKRLIADIKALHEEWEREEWWAERLANPATRATALRLVGAEAAALTLPATSRAETERGSANAGLGIREPAESSPVRAMGSPRSVSAWPPATSRGADGAETTGRLDTSGAPRGAAHGTRGSGTGGLAREVTAPRPLLVTLSYRFYRLRHQIGCAIGLHDLTGYKDCGAGVNVAPFNPRGRPGLKCFRKCKWCGARWKGAYDPIYGPFWQRCP